MQSKYGTGTIQHKNGKWLWVGYYKDKTGKIKRPQKTFDTEKEALLFQAEQISKTTIKNEKLSQDLTLEVVFKKWLQETTVSETTKKNTTANFNKHLLPLMGKQKIKNLNQLTLSRYLNDLCENQGKSTKTVYNIYTDLKTVINFAIKEKIIYENPLSDFTPPKPKAQHTAKNVLTTEDYTKIMMNEENQKTFYYNAIMFLGETGIRASELAIKEQDIHKTVIEGEEVYYTTLERSIKRVLSNDNKTTTIKVINDLKTTQSERTIYFNGFATGAIKKQLEYKKEHKIKSPFIFTTSTGTLMEQRNLLRAFHDMCKRAEVKPMGLHSLRKCFINRTLANGVEPFDLAKFTGHSIQTMFKYYHSLGNKTALKIINASENR